MSRILIMQVSVIIVNYNTKDLTAECIESVFEQTKEIEFEVILVDNASTDGSVELFSKDSRIVFMPSSLNLGFGRANNKGLEVATGEYVFFLNSDTLLGNNAIKLFYDKIEESPNEVACLGTLLYDKDDNIIHSFGALPTKAKSLFYWTFLGSIYRFCGFRGLLYDNPSDIKGEFFNVGYVTGADMFVRNSVIKELGAFDKDFFMYYEDTDMQKRYREHGYKSYIYSIPKVYHLHGSSSKSKPALRKRILSNNSLFIYFKKHSSRVGYKLFRFAFTIFSLPVLFHFRHTWKDKLAYIKATMCGVN